jgi:hypothetical protein
MRIWIAIGIVVLSSGTSNATWVDKLMNIAPPLTTEEKTLKGPSADLGRVYTVYRAGAACIKRSEAWSAALLDQLKAVGLELKKEVSESDQAVAWKLGQSQSQRTVEGIEYWSADDVQLYCDTWWGNAKGFLDDYAKQKKPPEAAPF